jgi:protein-S-isoprenylcysteine O-methyltransferase Ste14
MNSSYVLAIVVVLLIVVVVSVDLLFFRNFLWERLMVNVGIVLIFAAFGLRFFKH